MTYEELKETVRSSSLVLVGLGEDLKGDLDGFYKSLSGLLAGKDCYIVTLGDRKGLEKAGFAPDRIAAPHQEGEPDGSWEAYLHWLGFTLNQKLCILELGAGFAHPEIIRFPFEKTCYFNRKSRLIRIHGTFWQLTAETAERGVSIQKDPVKYFLEMAADEEERG